MEYLRCEISPDGEVRDLFWAENAYRLAVFRRGGFNGIRPYEGKVSRRAFFCASLRDAGKGRAGTKTKINYVFQHQSE